MYNSANFHIRQHMTGLRKGFHARQPNEQESIDYVRTGIDRINAHYESGGKTKRFPYPTPEQWFPGYYVLEAVFKMQKNEEYRHLPAQVSQKAEVPDRCISIDLGVENFAAIANNIGKPPILVRGNVMKSRNWWFNQQIAAAESKEMVRLKDSRKYAVTRRIHRLELRRQRFFRDYFHKITNRLMDYCSENRIDTIVVGKNDGWKQKVNMGTVNNRNFVRIPYEMFVKQLSYKAERHGIRLVMQEESYTSKASFPDNDPLPGYSKEAGVYAFSGKRIYRGLYVSSSGEVLHSDVNGACNILRKALPKAFDDLENFRYLKNLVSW